MKNTFFRSKRFLSVFIAVIMVIASIPTIPVKAQNIIEKYPYTMFAASNKEGAITINAGNFCVNGNIASNGTIISSGDMNINGIKTENADENMIYILNKLDNTYFKNENTDIYQEDYNYKDINININKSVKVNGKLELEGNVNLNNKIKALSDVKIDGNVINANNSIICSEAGNIIINSQNVNLSGFLYAPYGNIEITAQNLNLNNVIIIADTIIINGQSVNVSYSNSMAELIGTKSDMDTENDKEQDNDEDIKKDKEIGILAFGDYNNETGSIDIFWFSDCTDGSYEILTSDDNETYTLEATVTNVYEYQYLITKDFLTKYFKVSVTTKNGKTAETFPFMIVKTKDGYTTSLIDSDSDKIEDEFEIEFGTDINNPDTDNDGLTDYQEIFITETNPLKFDSVTNGVSDANADSDKDGLSNLREIELGTNPLNTDTDDDGLSDYDEINLYGTNPLKADTDDDGINDSDEIHINLDPTNPKTFGVPDAEYKINQTILSESKALSNINTEENAYKLSLEITAAGYVEGNLTAEETGYANAIQNDSMIGIAPELSYTNADSIENVTLKFQIQPEYLENTLNLFPEVEELKGIKRLNIFKYYEDINMLLPIETCFDTDNNIVYTNVDELGTYCVMDMEIWFDSFNIHEETYQSEPMMMLLEDNEEAKFVQEDTIMAFRGKTTDNKADYSGDKIETKLSEETEISEDDIIFMQDTISTFDISTVDMSNIDVPTAMSLNANDKVTPIDAVFLLQTAGELIYTFNSQKDMIADVMQLLINKYGMGNVRFHIITYGLSSASVLKSGNRDYFIDVSSLKNALDEIEYEYTYGYADRGKSFEILQNEIKFKQNAAKFIFQIMNGATGVGSTYFDQINTCKRLGINYSEIIPDGYFYVDTVYGQMVYDAITSTKGMNIYYDERYTTAKVFNHIATNAASPQLDFNIKLPTNWKYITLNGILDPLNGVNSDEDDLTDWEEVDTRRIKWNTDGSLILPTVREFVSVSTIKTYENILLELVMTDKYSDAKYDELKDLIETVFDETYVLPILSDPTNKDTDGDGLLDGTPQYHIFEEDRKKVIAPADPEPMNYTGPKNLWINHINEMINGVVPTKYKSEGNVSDIQISKDDAYFLVELALKMRGFVNDNKKFARWAALKIKKFSKGDLQEKYGADFLNFVYDDKNMAYHSQIDTWQRNFGYNVLYDEVFEIGSKMNYGKIKFNASIEDTEDAKEYVLWAWKGDYWNLESGAEVGLYVFNSEISGTEHYDVVDFEVPMTLSLYNSIDVGKFENIFNWVPIRDQWWITGFNPKFTEPNPEIMVSVASVDFSGYTNFYNAIRNIVIEDFENDLKKKNIIFDEKTKTIWLQWYNEGVK